jgi:glycerate kinase
VRALLCPASLKGVLSAAAAADALAEGFRLAGADRETLPVADGGEGTTEALHHALGGEWREAIVSDPLGRPVRARWLVLPDGTAVVEAASAIGLPLLEATERNPLRTTSRGLGELLLAALEEYPSSLIVGLGGTATVDGGAGVRGVVRRLDVPTRVLCDVRTTLAGAARLFGPQKGASPEAVAELERRLADDEALGPYAGLPGSGAAGGLGAGLAALGAALVPGAATVLDLVGLDARIARADLVVTGEGQVDATTAEGKAPAVVAERCLRVGARCVVFGGRVIESLPGVETLALSGDPRHVRQDLVALGQRLAGRG